MPPPTSSKPSFRPNRMTSSPAPALMVSLPLPPVMMSFPPPALMVSSPAPPLITSSPRPVVMRSAPARPCTLSRPSVPVRVSGPVVPTMTSPTTPEAADRTDSAVPWLSVYDTLTRSGLFTCACAGVNEAPVAPAIALNGVPPPIAPCCHWKEKETPTRPRRRRDGGPGGAGNRAEWGAAADPPLLPLEGEGDAHQAVGVDDPRRVGGEGFRLLRRRRAQRRHAGRRIVDVGDRCCCRG